MKSLPFKHIHLLLLTSLDIHFHRIRLHQNTCSRLIYVCSAHLLTMQKKKQFTAMKIYVLMEEKNFFGWPFFAFSLSFHISIICTILVHYSLQYNVCNACMYVCTINNQPFSARLNMYPIYNIYRVHRIPVRNAKYIVAIRLLSFLTDWSMDHC